MDLFPGKLYYKIREVCKIAGVKAHVLRFWETEFPALSPQKSRNGQRVYRPGDIELILKIRKLLYEDGYTIAGARKQMGMRAPTSAPKRRATQFAKPSDTEPLPEKPPIFPTPDAVDDNQAAERLKRVQAELENILTLLDRE